MRASDLGRGTTYSLFILEYKMQGRVNWENVTCETSRRN